MKFRTSLLLFSAQIFLTLNAISQTTNITLNILGSDTVYLEVFTEAYVEQGFNAYSNTGTNITHQVTVTNDIDTTKLGTYLVIYSITDSFGFRYTKGRKIIVQDTKKPIIKTISGRDTIEHQIGTPFDVSMYLIVEDNYWGINASELVRTGNINVNQQGLYTLRYNVTDGSGNAATEFFVQVFVRDIIPPVIVLNGSPEVMVDVFGAFNDPGVTATDNFTLNLIIINDRAQILNTNKLGTYTITYTAIDAAGNRSSVQRKVMVVDRESPTIYLQGPNPFRMDINDDYDTIDPGVKAIDNYWWEDSIIITIDKSQLNISEVGTYYVYYSATDKSGNISNFIYRKVDVTFPLSLNEKASNIEESLSTYPNPSSGQVNIESKSIISGITVFDLSGKLIKTVLPINTNAIITIEKNGLYVLLIETAKGVYTERVSIQH
jgi:hypothetical protein